jgi:SAM-dependent methyltransferase
MGRSTSNTARQSLQRYSYSATRIEYDAVGISQQLFARVWPSIAAAGERMGQGEFRREMLAGLTGRVLEIGAGSGTNFAHYPETVSEVIAVEPDARLRRLARQAALQAPVLVNVVPGSSDDLPEPSGSFDAAVTSLVLCTVPSQGRALAGVRRAVRPGGELRFYEHVIADRPGLVRFQRALDATVWPLLAAGCHLTRDTAAAIQQAGFTITSMRRFVFRPCVLAAPTSHYILGTAIVPAAAPARVPARSARV